MRRHSCIFLNHREKSLWRFPKASVPHRQQTKLDKFTTPDYSENFRNISLLISLTLIICHPLDFYNFPLPQVSHNLHNIYISQCATFPPLSLDTQMLPATIILFTLRKPGLSHQLITLLFPFNDPRIMKKSKTPFASFWCKQLQKMLGSGPRPVNGPLAPTARSIVLTLHGEPKEVSQMYSAASTPHI